MQPYGAAGSRWSLWNSNAAAVCCHLHWCSCSHPNDWLPMVVSLFICGGMIVSSLSLLLCSIGLRATLQISDASTHRSSLDIRCLGAVLVQHSWEGLFWRGYIFPRQELAFKQYTWFVHGCCWWTFHIRLKCTNDPHPDYFHHIVRGSKDKEYWSDIIIHSLINGSGFLLVAFRIAG